MSLVIRPARPADATELHRLIVALATYEREPDAVELTPERLREQLAAERPPFECLLAELDDRVVGFALHFANYSTWRGRPGLYLEDLFVEPAHRARGIGHRLLVELARLAVARGCGRMDWMVLDWNTPAIDFYRRIGARPVDGWVAHRLTGDALLALARAEP